MRHLISLREQSKKDLLEILTLAQRLKKERAAGKLKPYLAGKTLIMLFQKSSTRTRLSFEAGMTELGGHAIYLDARSSQLSLADFKDEIRAIMRFGSVLMFRALKAADVELAASFNMIPVIDACSEKYHPCQALGDILTMIEHTKGGLKNIKKIAWLGVENNVSNTLRTASEKLGIKVVSELKDLQDAQFLHTDTWMDMEYFDANGKVKPEFQKEYKKRIAANMPKQISAKLLAQYCPDAKIMHCMPCHVGYEISRDAIDHPNSIIFDQAENRMHIQKAIILWLLQK
ncbi:MAG: ornithine carbamoyltransferase [Patescibacteria group bacterium]